MKKALVLFMLLLVAVALSAQETKSLSGFKYQYKVGVLPFMDATGGGDEAGAVVGRAVQAELAHSTDLMGRVLKLEDGTTADDIDPQKAIQLGKKRHVDVVIVGTVLEANSERSHHNVRGPSIFGQSTSVSSNSMKAVVTIQGDVFNVVNGKKIDSFRATGSATDTKVGANVSTTLGDLSNGASSANSPIGKALQAAVADLVKKVAAAEPKMLRADMASGTDEEKAE